MKIEQFDKLVNQGRDLLVSDEHVTNVHRDFNKWFEDVTKWLQENFPNSSFSADWSSLGVSQLVRQGGFDNSDYTTNLFQIMIRTRLKWLSNLMTVYRNTLSKHIEGTGKLIIGKKVFIVHGRNNEMKEAVSRFLGKLGLEPVILHEQPNAGKTIIEKFLDYADVSFAIILTREWFKKAAPVLKVLTGTLSLILPVASSGIKLAVEEAAYKTIEKQLDFGKEIIDASLTGSEKVVEWLGEKDETSIERGLGTRAEGSILRKLHAFLAKEDPSFGDLVRVTNKRQEFLWVHEKFASEY